jgi:hypothetical protein
VGEAHPVVLQLAEDVGGALAQPEVVAEHPRRVAQPEHVEDRVAGDQGARALVQERDVPGGVAGRRDHAQPARDVQHLPVAELLGHRNGREPPVLQPREDPAHRARPVVRR